MPSPSQTITFIITIFAVLFLAEHFTSPSTKSALLNTFGLPNPASLMNWPTPSLPKDNLASSQFAAWLKAFNSKDRETLLEYHSAHFPYEAASADVGSLDREMALATAVGGFDVADVPESKSKDEDSDEALNEITVILREKRDPKYPRYARAMMRVDARKDDRPVTKFEIGPTNTPRKFVPDDRKEEYDRALAPLTSARRRMVVDEICEILRTQYVIPDLGDQMGEDLQDNLRKGAYDNIEVSEDFAKRLQKDMHASSHDRHIGVFFHEPLPPPDDDEPDDDPANRKPQKFYNLFREMNFGFGNTSVETIKQSFKLAILPINGFLPCSPDIAADSDRIRAAISDILSNIADADALIVDLRHNGGGHPDTVAFILSYLLSHNPVHLNDMVDRNGSIDSSYSTLAPSELPDGAIRFGGEKPLFVLTSLDTISGGEEMAYDVQALKRAKIVGEDETTAGAANPVTRPRSICQEEFGKHWWIVAVPGLRPVNDVTGGNWEGIGVRSDVVARKNEDAMDVARGLVREALGVNADGSEKLLVQDDRV